MAGRGESSPPSSCLPSSSRTYVNPISGSPPDPSVNDFFMFAKMIINKVLPSLLQIHQVLYPASHLPPCPVAVGDLLLVVSVLPGLSSLSQAWMQGNT